MIWNDHSNIQGTHALLSPSDYAWLNYSDDEYEEKLIRKIDSKEAPAIGTITHAFAADRIRYRKPIGEANADDLLIALLKNGIPEHLIHIERFYPILVAYVNDAIELNMDPEITLSYMDGIFHGTADTIYYENYILRIHDLKTGTVKANFDQLLLYAALFFLEYGKKLKIKPDMVQTELRIYQGNEIGKYVPSAEEICECMRRSTKRSSFSKKYLEGKI